MFSAGNLLIAGDEDAMRLEIPVLQAATTTVYS